jgi:Tol biopolymer transport system component
MRFAGNKFTQIERAVRLHTWMRNMKIFWKSDFGHASRALCAALLCPLLLFGCNSAPTGHAPGLAGGESLTPGVTNYPLAYIKRPVPTTDIDVRDLITSTTGGDLYVRAQASAGGLESNVTSSITLGKGDVRDLDVSPDGTKLVFSLRLPLNPALKNTDPKQPNWHIYQYDASTKVVTQLTNDDITAGHDVGAHYLADGRIVFSSTRQVATQAILLDEGRPQYQAQTDDRQQSIFLLHVMNADGTNMQQISFNTNHDFDPSLLANGQIVFSRWEVVNGTDQISLFTANVDGSGEQLLYGANSHATGANIAGTNNNVIQFLNARQRADGKLIAIDRPFLNTQLGGDILLIDTANYVEINQTSSPPGTTTTPGQMSATTLGVTTDQKLPSLGGRFYSAYPLYDGTNRMLVSWSPCLVTVSNTTQICTSANTAGTNLVLAPPQYTLWIYDFDAGTLSPVLGAAAGQMVVEPVVMQSRTPVPAFPPVPTLTTAQQNMVTAQVGLLDISSVYDFDGVDTAVPDIAGVSDPTQAAFYTRPARFIRIEKAVEIPSEKVRKISDSAFGPAGMGMREILGYAPIQPDGSVQIQVPADVPFTIDVVDVNARRIGAQHNSWLQLVPGEIKNCNGCHSTTKMTSHGRSGLTTAVNTGAPTTGLPFPNTNPNLFANAGETMAQTLSRLTCGTNPPVAGGCSQVLSTDVIYNPIWTTGVTLPAGDVDAPVAYTYAALNEAPPTNGNCAPWSAQCRITIHYASAALMSQPFLQQMWNLTTRTATVNGATASVTCTNCHNTLSAKSVVQVPAGQLDLTGKASTVDTTVVTSYEDLLFPHDEQTLNMGLLVNVMVPGTGGATMPVQLDPVMTAGNAAASQPNFLSKFDGVDHGVTVDHTGYLSQAELRLISEWLDIGAQYYNDPFVAPVAN